MFLFLLPLILLFSGCDPVGDIIPKKNTTYGVKKGDHAFQPRATGFVRTETLKFKAKLRSNTTYDLKDPFNQVNKLYGFSDCTDLHKENSARFGWKFADNQMYIIPFIHFNGEQRHKDEEYLGIIQLDKWYEYELKIEGREYVFSMKLDNGQWTSQRHERACSGDKEIKYLLQPYFGGNTPAPHEMQIEIELI